MNFINKLFKTNGSKSSSGAFFKSSEKEMNNFLCGIGNSAINDNTISISNYPFEPSNAYPHKTLSADEIKSVCVEFGVCQIFVGDDIVFLTAEKKEELKAFAQSKQIPLSEKSWNWDWILEPYLDTELTTERANEVLESLNEKGFDRAEVNLIRNEVGKQMFKYNFDTMLWEWCSLGLADVLAAMRVKYNQQEFRDFYKKAIAIEKRGAAF